MGVLVTGGAGYIGSVTVEQLAAAGEEVTVIDNLATGHRGALHPQATFFEASLLDPDSLQQLFAAHDIDCVLHFAAASLVGESMQDPHKYFGNNVVGAHALLGAMLDAGVRNLILSSTAAVYGMPAKTPITEDFPTAPVNPYGRSKRMIEEMLEWHAHAYGLKYVSLRYFNAAGASAVYGEHHEPETHLIPNVLRAADGQRGHVSIFGQDYPTPDGTCVRDYIHVEDLAAAHLAAMRHLRQGGGPDVFNLGSARGTSVHEVVESVRRVTGRDVPVEHGPRREGDPPVLVASSEKATQVLGWRPVKGDIDTIVSDAWRWHQAHPHGYAAGAASTAKAPGA